MLKMWILLCVSCFLIRSSNAITIWVSPFAESEKYIFLSVYPKTGQNRYTYKTTEVSNSIPKAASTIVLEYLVLVVHWLTISHLVTLTSPPLGMRYTD